MITYSSHNCKERIHIPVLEFWRMPKGTRCQFTVGKLYGVGGALPAGQMSTGDLHLMVRVPSNKTKIQTPKWVSGFLVRRKGPPDLLVRMHINSFFQTYYTLYFAYFIVYYMNAQFFIAQFSHFFSVRSKSATRSYPFPVHSPFPYIFVEKR